MKKHPITDVIEGSIAEELDIEAGDSLLAINDREILDYFDYEYLVREDYLEMLIEKADGEEWLLQIDKDPFEDMGLVFENDMMDGYRSCANKCIFCFIDQLPKGMRESLYFKDDDSRLSFLHGNYVTLTNMSDYDIDRIIEYRMSPIYISFQTTNPELRCRMLGNRFAGESLKKADRLYRAGIEMNGQIVLCKNVNDGEELSHTIKDLSGYAPYLKSVSVVPVGLTKHREGLFKLDPFDKADAEAVIDLIEDWQKKMYSEYGYHFIHASDEFYLLAQRTLPEAERYDGYLQYENGVGMLRSLMDDFSEAFEEFMKNTGKSPGLFNGKRTVSIATGCLSYPAISEMAKKLTDAIPGLSILVYPIRNDFFGERITVTGLLTGQDIERQLKGKRLGETLLLSETLAREDDCLLLDGMSTADLEKSLQVKIDIVKSNGMDFIEKTVIGKNLLA
ncbi:MAG: DUF512 domain-containing protein [Lachnospiraceae bacterium]|nr:DUF512 domain-containing protein [Lachnospiraceae bacterium]